MRFQEISVQPFISNIKNEISFLVYDKVTNITRKNKKIKVIQISSDSEFLNGFDHAYHKSESGVVLWLHENQILEIVDLGIAEKYQNQGYGRKIINLIVKHFPNHTIYVNDDSKGFWNYIIPQYTNIEKI